jgi:formamidopyrimidine-DNA glycosylase
LPELPEVETIRRALAPLVEGRTLTRLTILDPRWTRPRPPEEVAAAVVGRRILRLQRRGKYLVWLLSGGLYLVQHLRMSGAVLCEPSPAPAHVRVEIKLWPRLHLVVVDPRRFGTAELIRGVDALEDFFADRLGLEPLAEGFTAGHLRALAHGRAVPIKALLLDQRRVAGVGNIYADEALFRAGVSPQRPACWLSHKQSVRLRDAVAEVLSEAIEAGGSSISDFRSVDGVHGAFQNSFRVHRRAGEPCPNCGRTIVKLRVAGRGTYVCERCQPLPLVMRPAARS